MPYLKTLLAYATLAAICSVAVTARAVYTNGAIYKKRKRKREANKRKRRRKEKEKETETEKEKEKETEKEENEERRTGLSLLKQKTYC
jgi:flagellar biosynthesis component FlhA